MLAASFKLNIKLLYLGLILEFIHIQYALALDKACMSLIYEPKLNLDFRHINFKYSNEVH